MPKGKPKGYPKTGGRQKGTPNKAVSGQDLRDIVIAAAEAADKDGVLGYLKSQALANPVAFLSLLGKAMPRENDVKITHKTTIEEWVLAIERRRQERLAPVNEPILIEGKAE